MMRWLRTAVVHVEDTHLEVTVRAPGRAPATQRIPWTVGTEEAAVAAARAWGGAVQRVWLAVGPSLLRRAAVALPPVSPADQRAMLALDPTRWFVASPGEALAVAAPDAAGVAYAADAPTIDAWVARLDTWAPVTTVTASPIATGATDARARLESPALSVRFRRQAIRQLVWWSNAAVCSVVLLGWSVDRARARRLAWLTAERAQVTQTEGNLLHDAAQVQQFYRDIAMTAAAADSGINAAGWLSRVAQQLPQDAVVQRVQFGDGVLQLHGSATSARRVLDALTAVPGVTSARLTAPVARVAGQSANRETFSIALAIR